MSLFQVFLETNPGGIQEESECLLCVLQADDPGRESWIRKGIPHWTAELETQRPSASLTNHGNVLSSSFSFLCPT